MINKWKYGGLPKFELTGSTINLSNTVSLGSCFARNITRWLNHNQLLNETSPWETLYNPYSIFYELQRLYNPYNLDGHFIEYLKENQKCLIDPSRTWIESISKETLTKLNEEFDKRARAIIESSSCVLITYGLSEVWNHIEHKSLVINNLPLRKKLINEESFQNRFLSVNEVKDIIGQTIELIRDKTSLGTPIIFTVSPIPLKFTCSGLDAKVANNISKSTLQIALMETYSNYEHIYYFPSYEIIQSFVEKPHLKVWQEDGRHINASTINSIGKLFLNFSRNQSKISVCKPSFFVPKVDANGKIIGECYD
ncbi:MAG: hypothetical protein Mars2KO_44290 [Maribacter sp.]